MDVTEGKTPEADVYRVRVYPGAPGRSLRHPFRLRWGWGVQIDHISQWDEHGDAEQFDGTDWFQSQAEAMEWGVMQAGGLHRNGGCDACNSLGIPQAKDLVIHCGPNVVVDERVSA